MMPKTPLFIVTGASCVGKTSVIPYVRSQLSEFDVFDMDLEGALNPEQTIDHWLKVAHQISLSDRGTVLFGTITPEAVQKSEIKNRFSHIYYINLHCDDEVRAKRLREKGAEEGQIEKHAILANWFIQNAHTAFTPPISTIDTSQHSPEQCARYIRKWVLKYWSSRYPLEIRAN